MYRTNDPRFRRRLNEIGQTLESANESAQSNLYIFGEHYLKPCLSSVAQSLTTCVDASCPSLNLSQRDRLRRRNQRGRAELSFDFYDDWDYEEENEGLLGGWGNDEFDRLTGGRGNVGGYGTVVEAQQPGRRRGMSYGGTGRRKSAVLPAGQDASGIPGSSSGGFWGRLFGGSGKGIRYKPGAADLQEHPGARHRDLTEGEALLQDIEEEGDGRRRRGHGRTRSGTAASHETSDSLSSRGDIFPSDEEDDAIPLDDEFAMVLERRTTQSGGASGGTESSSQKTDPQQARRKSKRPSIASRTSTRRTVSSQSVQSLNRRKNRSRAGSKGAQRTPSEAEESIPSLSELKKEEDRVEREEEAEVELRRQEAQRLAAERGLAEEAILSSKEATPQESREPSQLPTPLPTDDEDETQQQQKAKQDAEEQQQKLTKKEERKDDDDTPSA